MSVLNFTLLPVRRLGACDHRWGGGGSGGGVEHVWGWWEGEMLRKQCLWRERSLESSACGGLFEVCEKRAAAARSEYSLWW